MVGQLHRGFNGHCFVFNGVTGALQYDVTSPVEQDSDFFGYAIAGLEDVDGDGRGDFVVGDVTGVVNGLEAGTAYVFSGALNTP